MACSILALLSASLQVHVSSLLVLVILQADTMLWLVKLALVAATAAKVARMRQQALLLLQTNGAIREVKARHGSHMRSKIILGCVVVVARNPRRPKDPFTLCQWCHFDQLMPVRQQCHFNYLILCQQWHFDQLMLLCQFNFKQLLLLYLPYLLHLIYQQYLHNNKARKTATCFLTTGWHGCLQRCI